MEQLLPKHLKLELHISNFNGPLDLLLHCIQEAKVKIRDIFVSQVTEQFLAYMTQLDEIDMDSASEFLEMAATLLEIKSKSLLPRPEEETPEEEDEKEKLFRQIEEYKLFKEAGEKLKEQETVDRFYKLPDDSAFEPQYILKDMSLDGLLNAFSKLLAKIDAREKGGAAPKEIRKDPVTVAQQIEHVKTVILEKKRADFFELFEEGYGKVEVITTFQALLELLKLQIITAEQEGVFANITILLKSGAEEILKTPLELDAELEA